MSNFDLLKVLQAHTPSPNTQRAYCRWVDRYLCDHVEAFRPLTGEERLLRLQTLNPTLLSDHLTEVKLRDWLTSLAEQNYSRQSLDQARAAVVTLAELAMANNLLEPLVYQRMHRVSPPPVDHKPSPERLLSPDELNAIVNAARDMATSGTQALRNHLVSTILCTMALRREELSSATWGDLAAQENRVVLRIEGSPVPVPRAIVPLLDKWRGLVSAASRDPLPHSALMRRIWKGGRIANEGLSPDGVWLIIHEAADYARLGSVTPDDLRRSAAAHLQQQGVSVAEISRLLRHRTVMITERFLARIQQAQPEGTLED